MVKATTVRVTLTLAMQFNWPLRQININNVFLNEDLIVTLMYPPGFVHPKHPEYYTN